MKRFIFGFILISAFLGIIYGSYKILNVPTYRIRFNSNGGSKVESILVKENETLKSIPIPSKDNYTFVGWYLDDSLFNLDLKINKDYTLNAVWEEEDIPTYHIYFDTLGGLTLESINLKKDETLKELPVAIKDGYEFDCWMYQNKVVEEIYGSKDMTLVAKFKKVN